MEIRQKLIDGCNQINIGLDETMAEQLIRYKEILLEYNKVMNLTAIVDDIEVITKHLIDSLIILKYVDLSNKKIIDVGTGAGFPGLPIKIANPSIIITLMDSTGKKINFLQEVINKLGLKDINLIWGRAEDFGTKKEYRETYDFCVSRAVANLCTLTEYCLPFVQVGGYFVSLKGPNIEEELAESKSSINTLGGIVERVEKYQLPFSDIVHSIVFIKKIRQTPSVYPRKAGKPSKEPIK